MLKIVDSSFEADQPPSSLVEVARQIRQANDHLAIASDMLTDIPLADRAKLQLAILGTIGKLGSVVVALVHEAAAKKSSFR